MNNLLSSIVDMRGFFPPYQEILIRWQPAETFAVCSKKKVWVFENTKKNVADLIYPVVSNCGYQPG